MEFLEKDKQRFWVKVNKTDTCWLWTAGCNAKGYGKFALKSRVMVLSHRVAWLLAGNTIPEGHVIRHKCRSTHCVNPEHLETGTQADNMADMIRDGTSTRGSKNISCKLTEDQVRMIKARNTENQTKLAEEFGVGKTTIHYIVTGRTWSWLN